MQGFGASPAFTPEISSMFSVHSTEGEARCGVLNTPNGAVNTPAMLVYTHRGGAVNLTVDLVEKLKPQLQALQLDVLQL
jgi:hypothetical protein